MFMYIPFTYKSISTHFNIFCNISIAGLNKTLYNTREETNSLTYVPLTTRLAPRVQNWHMRERNSYFLHSYCNILFFKAK